MNKTYKPEYKENQLIYGDPGRTVIVTGWTSKDYVAKRLEKKDYAAIGNLYNSTRGLSYLIRNLLYNPQIRQVVILNATENDRVSGSAQCLFDFFHRGFERHQNERGHRRWKVNSEFDGYIDIEISKTDLEDLRTKVGCVMYSKIDSMVEALRDLNRDLPDEDWAYPKTYVEPTLNEFEVFPGALCGHLVRGHTIAETWLKVLHRVRSMGVSRPTGYDGKIQEIIDVMAVVTDEPTGLHFEDYLLVDKAYIHQYVHQIINDAQYQEGVKYTYGQRLRSWFGRDQVQQVINKLIKEPDAASAVMSLWDVEDHDRGGSPCLNHIWVRVVGHDLHMTAVFRSHDMYSAWVPNVMGLRTLQVLIRNEVNKMRDGTKLGIGNLVVISQSAHIYDDTWVEVDALLDTQYDKLFHKRDYEDPGGDYLIEVEHNKIVVQRTALGGGEVLKTYYGSHPLVMSRRIIRDNPEIDPEHAAYLGIELERAWRLGDNYVQDNHRL